VTRIMIPEVLAHNKLMNIPYSDWGHWHFGETMYTSSVGHEDTPSIKRLVWIC
jgi:hypothetical protein